MSLSFKTVEVPAITTSDMTAISDSVAGAVESGNVDAALQMTAALSEAMTDDSDSDALRDSLVAQVAALSTESTLSSTADVTRAIQATAGLVNGQAGKRLAKATKKKALEALATSLSVGSEIAGSEAAGETYAEAIDESIITAAMQSITSMLPDADDSDATEDADFSQSMHGGLESLSAALAVGATCGAAASTSTSGSTEMSCQRQTLDALEGGSGAFTLPAIDSLTGGDDGCVNMQKWATETAVLQSSNLPISSGWQSLSLSEAVSGLPESAGIEITFTHAKLPDTLESRECLWFDPVVGNYSTSGCKPISATETSTTCSCTHLTTFTLSSEDPKDDVPSVNTVDVTDVESLGEIQDFTTLAIVCVSWMVFLLLVPIACKSDTKHNNLFYLLRMEFKSSNLNSSSGFVRQGTRELGEIQKPPKRNQIAPAKSNKYLTPVDVEEEAPNKGTPTHSSMGARIKNRMKFRHGWISVAFREKESSFTKVQRLILLLLTIQLTLVANAMVYDDDNSLGEYNLTNAIITGVFMSLIVAPLPLLLSFLCKRSLPANISLAEMNCLISYLYPGRKITKRLPSAVGTLAVWLAFFGSVFASYVTVLYGISFPEAVVKGWLVSTGISILQSIVINEPLQIVFALVISAIFGDVVSQIASAFALA